MEVFLPFFFLFKKEAKRLYSRGASLTYYKKDLFLPNKYRQHKHSLQWTKWCCSLASFSPTSSVSLTKFPGSAFFFFYLMVD